MSNRDIALGVVREMTDEQIDAFLSLFVNEDLIARLEAESIANDPESPTFDTVDGSSALPCSKRISKTP